MAIVHWRRRGCVAVGVVALAAMTPLTASAQQPAPGPKKEAPAPDEKALNEAKTRFKVGLSLYDDGAYDAARVEFERSYELAPSYKILYNIGLVYKQLNEFVGALKAFKQYLAEGGAEIPEARQTEVKDAVASLERLVGSAMVTVNVPGAEISVDDVVVGKSPLEAPVLLNPGMRKIGAKLSGKIPDSKVITVASGDRPTVELTLQDNARFVEEKNPYVLPTVISWGATAVVLLGSGVTAYFASQAESDLKDQRAVLGGPELRGQLDEKSSDTKTLAAVADIGFLASVIGAGISTYFTIKLVGFSGTEAPKEAEKPAAFNVKFRPMPNGIGGTF